MVVCSRLQTKKVKTTAKKQQKNQLNNEQRSTLRNGPSIGNKKHKKRIHFKFQGNSQQSDEKHLGLEENFKTANSA